MKFQVTSYLTQIAIQITSQFSQMAAVRSPLSTDKRTAVKFGKEASKFVTYLSIIRTVLKALNLFLI
jgi:hypothetical protein